MSLSPPKVGTSTHLIQVPDHFWVCSRKVRRGSPDKTTGYVLKRKGSHLHLEIKWSAVLEYIIGPHTMLKQGILGLILTGGSWLCRARGSMYGCQCKWAGRRIFNATEQIYISLSHWLSDSFSSTKLLGQLPQQNEQMKTIKGHHHTTKLQLLAILDQRM